MIEEITPQETSEIVAAVEAATRRKRLWKRAISLLKFLTVVAFASVLTFHRADLIDEHDWLLFTIFLGMSTAAYYEGYLEGRLRSPGVRIRVGRK